MFAQGEASAAMPAALLTQSRLDPGLARKVENVPGRVLSVLPEQFRHEESKTLADLFRQVEAEVDSPTDPPYRATSRRR